MSKDQKNIWAHTIVYNEENFIYFAIKSVIDFVDKILVYDTGSTDKTVKIIKQLNLDYPQKIIFKEKGKVDKFELTKLRQEMINESKCDWFIILDGDEIWPEQSIKSLIKTINEKGDHIDAIYVPFINLVGDIYHYQDSSVGNYKIQDKKGFFTIRAINKYIPGLHLDRPYPNEGFFDKENVLLQDKEKDKLIFLDAPFLHCTHLKRTTKEQQKNKYKYELGKKFKKDFVYPKTFFENPPKYVSPIWQKAGAHYLLWSYLLYPMKLLRRMFKN